MFAVFYIIALLAVPLVLHRRGGGVVALFASVAVVHLAFAALVSVWFAVAPGSFVWAFAPEQALLAGAEAIRERHALSNAPARSMRTLATIWGVIALAIWLFARWNALYFPGAVKALFWALNLCLVCAYATTIWMTFLALSRGTAPAPETFALAKNLKFAVGVGLVLSFAGLLALFADALFRRLRRGPAGI